jgi:hypothetical protein
VNAEDKKCTVSCESGLKSIHKLDFLCIQGRKAAAIFSLKVMGVSRYKMSLCQWMYKEKGKSLTFLTLLLVIYN